MRRLAYLPRPRGRTLLWLYQDYQALGTALFRVVLSVPAPLTGVLLTLSLKPQCSHSIQMRTER